MKPFSIVLITIGALIVAAVAFAASGLYNVSAKAPHLAPTSLLLEVFRERSIEHHSGKVEWPVTSDDQTLAMAGAVHFDATCRKCHGAPGRPRDEFAQGMYPKPPLLSKEKELDRNEIFWVVDNGLKMTGMPAFGVNHEHEELLAITAFVEKLQQLDEASYPKFVEDAEAQSGGEGHQHHDDEASAPEGHPEEPHGHSHEENGHHQ